VLHAHERTIARPEKKVHVDKSVEKRMTRHGIESPETTGLRLGEPKSRHLKEFTLNAPNDFIERTADFRRHQFLYSSARVVNLDCRYRRFSNLCTRATPAERSQRSRKIVGLSAVPFRALVISLVVNVYRCFSIGRQV
jgi:hypothetical protein